jgi:hypothetical protein
MKVNSGLHESLFRTPRPDSNDTVVIQADVLVVVDGGRIPRRALATDMSLVEPIVAARPTVLQGQNVVADAHVLC